jgi:hypothetical protein
METTCIWKPVDGRFLYRRKTPDAFVEAQPAGVAFGDNDSLPFRWTPAERADNFRNKARRMYTADV